MDVTMKHNKSVAEIKAYLSTRDVSEQELFQFKKDTRKGVQHAIVQYEKQQQKILAMELSFQEMMRHEQSLYDQGKEYIAGVDEVGRGPLAGPVVAATVILPKDFHLLGITDSKQLTKEKREFFFEKIKSSAISYAVGVVDNIEIDRINIYQATIKAMKQAVERLDPCPDHLLVDAVELPGLSCSSDAIIKGDQKSISIAAASIIAKVTRDQMMAELHEQMPVYQFDKNQGYGTAVHIEALKQYGPTIYHRKTFAPVKDFLG